MVVDDAGATAHEAHVTSDIAEGWDPRCQMSQSAGSPDDADFGAVMSMSNDGLSKDPKDQIAEVLQAVKEAKKETRCTIEVAAKPICEFTEFPRMLSGGFPAEFPLGVTDEDLGGPGPLKQAVLNRLLKFYDGRVAKNPILLLWLTNMRMRHKAIGTTSAYARKESQEQLVRFMNSRSFEIDCAIAEQDPTSEEAQELVRRVGPFLRLAGSKVPWGPLERLSATYHLYALYHTFGPPGFFITFAPKTITNAMVLKFGCMQAGEVITADLNLPENLQRRVELLASNTIAQARAYSLIVRMVAEILFGIPCTHTVKKTRKPVVGLFGLANAFYGVHEVQSRNALHAHLVLWTKAVDPRLVHRHVHRESVRAKFVEIIDTVVRASTEDFEHEYSGVAKADGRDNQVGSVQSGDDKFVRPNTQDVVVMKMQQPYYRQSQAGLKLVEARPNYPSYHGLRSGDYFKMKDVSSGDSFKCRVIYKKVYPDFKTMLKDETVEACLPDHKGDLTSAEARYHSFRKGSYAKLAAKHRVVALRFSACQDGPISTAGRCGEANAVAKTASTTEHVGKKVDVATVPLGPVSLDVGPGDIVPGVCLYDSGGLGWVRIVYADPRTSDGPGRKVIVRPVVRPGGCYLPAPGVAALGRIHNDYAIIEQSEPTRFQVDVGFNEEFPHLSGKKWCVTKYASGVQQPVGTRVWVWDRAGAIESLMATRLYIRGHRVKGAYNTHCHCFTCHKYKDTYRAKYCRMGFGRRECAETKFSQVVQVNPAKPKASQSEKDGGPMTQAEHNATSSVTETHLHAKETGGRQRVVCAAPKIQKSEEREKAAVCLDLKRLSGPFARNHVYEMVAKGIFLMLAPRTGIPQACANLVSEFLLGAAPEYDDCYQTETNILFAALLGCNTNVSPLGALTQAASAMFYLAGYLSKNPIKPCHYVTCMTAARKAAKKFGSTAEDAGTKMRNAIFLIQNMLNRLNAAAEVADTQGSMFLLGEPSWISSHPFRFCFATAAVQYQIAQLCAGNDRAEPEGSCGENESSCAGDDRAEPEGSCGENESSCAGDDRAEPEGSCEFSCEFSDIAWTHPSNASVQSTADSMVQRPSMVHGKGGGAMLYTDHEGVLHALSQHDFYKNRVFNWDSTVDGVVPDMRWWYEHARGVAHAGWTRWNLERGLERLNLVQYATHVDIIKKPGNFQELRRSGRKGNMFLLNVDNPLYESHVQKLRSRDHIAVLSGKAPRKPRGECPMEGRARRRWMQRADAWAIYVGALLSPWDRRGLSGVTSYEGLLGLMERWRERSNREHWRAWSLYINRDRERNLEAAMPDAPFPDPIGNFLMDFENNVNTNMRVPAIRKTLANEWRYENSDRFTKEEQTKAIVRGGKVRSKAQSDENALAIARLIDTRAKQRDGGIREDTRVHLELLQTQLDKLDLGAVHTRGSRPAHPRGLAAWDTESRQLNAAWASKRLKDLQAQNPESDLEEETTGRAGTDGEESLEDLRSGCADHPDKRRRHRLSPDQLQAFEQAVRKLRAGEQLLMFVHGPPGTGKTVLAGRIAAAAKRLGIKSQFAALSGAAATLGNGTTIHYLTNMGIVIPPHHSKVSAQTVKTMRERGGTFGLLTLDEISMVHAKLLSAIEHRFTEADILGHTAAAKEDGGTVVWGGMHIILLGDMLQLPPPSNFAKAMYVDCVDETAGGIKYDKDLQLYHGVSMFRGFVKVELSTQNRAKGDVDHMKYIHRLRTHKQPVCAAMLRKLKFLSSRDVSKYRWKFAPRLVTSNLERFLINKHQVISYARETGRCVFTWVDRITNAPLEVSEEEDEQLDPSARRYFVYGAPAYITQNLNSAATGLVNGSKGYLHSLTWSDADAKAERLPPPGRTGELVEVPVPLAVNVFIPGLTDEDETGEMVSASQDFADRLVPVFAQASTSNKADAVLARQRHSFDLGFCITYHKVQGQTLDEVVLVLHRRKAKQLLNLCFEMLYVGLTRVRRTADIRVLYFEEDGTAGQPRKKRKRSRRKWQIIPDINPGLEHLLKLKRPIHFDAWLSGYNKSGRWDDAVLQAQAAKDRDTALKALAQPVTLTHASYTVPKLKGLAKALGLDVPKAPGKTYSNKEQYLSVIYPVWARLGDKRKLPERYSAGHQQTADDSDDKDMADKDSADKDTEKRLLTHSNGKHEDTGSDSEENRKPEITLDCIAASRLRIIRDAMSQLRSRRRQSSRQELRTRVYSQQLPQIGKVSEYDAAGLLEGHMMCDSILHSGAQTLCAGSRVHPVDPLAVRYEKLLLQSGALARERGMRARNCRDANILCKLQSGYTLALPYNVPENVHWIPVFA